MSKIKYDQHGNPDWAKYRIVVLGNLDPTNWSAADCFAPCSLCTRKSTHDLPCCAISCHPQIRGFHTNILSKPFTRKMKNMSANRQQTVQSLHLTLTFSFEKPYSTVSSIALDTSMRLLRNTLSKSYFLPPPMLPASFPGQLLRGVPSFMSACTSMTSFTSPQIPPQNVNLSAASMKRHH